MPKYITVKRADVSNLDEHLLRDGEPAFSRYRTLDGGPQHGETIKDFDLRIGDGTTPGGVSPNGNLNNAALSFAISTAAIALEEIELLKARVYSLENP